MFVKWNQYSLKNTRITKFNIINTENNQKIDV